VALDIAEPVTDVVTADTTLSEAIELMEHDKIEYVPVVVSQQSGEYAGVLDSRAMSRQLSAEVLSKQQEADRMYARRTA
jgi:CBS domain-containing protein